MELACKRSKTKNWPGLLEVTVTLVLFFSMPLSSWGFGMFGRAEKSGEIWGASFADFTEGYSDFAEGYNKIIPISPRATFADWF